MEKDTIMESYGLKITLLLSDGSSKIIGKAAHERPVFKGKVFDYHQRGLRQGIRSTGVVRVKDAHKVENCSERDWYLPHHWVVNPNAPCKVRRVQNGAAKFHGA